MTEIDYDTPPDFRNHPQRIIAINEDDTTTGWLFFTKRGMINRTHVYEQDGVKLFRIEHRASYSGDYYDTDFMPWEEHVFYDRMRMAAMIKTTLNRKPKK